MSFNIEGRRFAQVTAISCAGEPAVGFSRLLFGLELSIRERRCEGRPAVRELLGDLFVSSGKDDQRHYVGRLHPTNAPLDISVDDSRASVCLDVELDGARVSALEELRRDRDLAFELSLRGRVFIGDECHRVADRQVVVVSGEDWTGILAQLGV